MFSSFAIESDTFSLLNVYFAAEAACAMLSFMDELKQQLTVLTSITFFVFELSISFFDACPGRLSMLQETSGCIKNTPLRLVMQSVSRDGREALHKLDAKPRPT